jgi:hypothetical protein
MAYRLLNEHAKYPRDLLPVAHYETFQRYWLPGAKVLGLKIVPRFGVLAISNEKKNLFYIPELIEELRLLRPWFEKNVPESERDYLVKRIDMLVEELTLISKQKEIDISIG